MPNSDAASIQGLLQDNLPVERSQVRNALQSVIRDIGESIHPEESGIHRLVGGGEQCSDPLIYGECEGQVLGQVLEVVAPTVYSPNRGSE